MIHPEVAAEDDPRSLAQAALAAVDQDPGSGVPIAEAALRTAVGAKDAYAASIAERAWGHALLHVGALEDAARHLTRAVTWGRKADAPESVAEARSKLAFARLQQGRPAAALREIDAALPDLEGVAAARAQAQRAIIRHVIGRLDEALIDYEAALRVLRRQQDRLGQQRLLINRSLVHADRFDFAAGLRDLAEAEVLARELGRPLTIGLIANNRGLMQTLAGDVPAALAELDRAETIIGEHGAQLGTLHQDRAQLLLSVGLTAEAELAAARSVAAYQSEGRALKVPEVRLLQAEAAALAGHPSRAAADAGQALRQFRAQGRPEWTELARLARLRAERSAGVRSRTPRAVLERMVDTLEAAGWPGAALDAAIVAGQLTRVATRSRSRGSALVRARGWYARALLAREQRRPIEAAAAVRRGLRILDEHAATMGASELRVHAAVHRADLVDVGLELALASGNPRRLFEWSERARASQLLAAPVRPPVDAELRTLLAELRTVTREVAEPSRPAAGPAIRQAQLERRIQARHRQLPGSATAGSEPARVSEISNELGSWALLEFVQHRGAVSALTLVDGRISHQPVAGSAEIGELMERLTFAYRRLSRPGRPAQAAVALLTDAATRLDTLLLAGHPELESRPLVIVPTGPLHSLPWSLLPSCAGRAITVAPSASLWRLAARRRAPTAGRVVAVAGPDLSAADTEARQVAELHHGRALTGAQASVAAVTDALSRADLLHVAAHGRLSADNPLFSALTMGDGPLMVYDIEELPAVPHTVVLAACDSGRPVVRTGDELLGLAVAFLARGTAQLIAPVMAVPDASTEPVMIELHHGLRDGLAPAEALARAQQDVLARGPEFLAAAAAFVCLGAGVRPIFTP